jgi:uncharacterized protein (TIGR03790 family)
VRLSFLRQFTLCFLLAALVALARGAEESVAARVILLANSDDPNSLRIARHYAEVRGVPAANIIALKMPRSETITWREFVATIWQPLLEVLVSTHWVDATPMSLNDAVGRQKYSPYSHRIAALVVCRGVPLKISHDAQLYLDVPPFTNRSELRTNAGAVDAELSLLAQPNYPINAFVPNPLFQHERPTLELARVVKVSRLDGPTVEDANALVDRAVAAERTGLLGRAYVDIANRDRTGDVCLETAAAKLAELGFDLAVDRDPATIPATARMDAPAIYLGWYTGDINGPFMLPGFRFPPGAIALHIHSFSAGTLRTTNTGWTGPFVARGVTATFGNVFEPYLQFTHRPDLLLRALARGATLVDAAYFSLPVLSWQAVLIGDPLYRPFAVSLADQTKDLKQLPMNLAGYAVVRDMRRLEAAGQHAEAIAAGISAQREVPSLVVAVALAQRLRERGDLDGGANALGFVPLLKTFEATEWALAREAAQLLEHCGRPARALDVWRALFAITAVPRELRVAWLPEAVKTARAASDLSQAAAWEKHVEELTAVAAEKK